MKTKSMVQGAMIAALFGALSLFNTYTAGFIDIFICYFMVVPLAWYGYQYDISSNFLVVVTSLIVIFITGMPYFFISSIASCFIGMFLGECLKRKAKKSTILLGTLIICFINNILIYQVFNGLLGIDMISEMTEMYNDIKAIVPMFNSISLQFILNLIPLVLLLTSVMEMYLIILICQLIFNRLKIAFPDNFHIATMHLSRNIGIILLICLLTSFILLNVVKLNNIILEYIYLLSAIVFVLQGYSFMNYYIIVKQKKLLIIISLLLFFIPMGLFIYLILGIIDIFSDLREILLYNRNTK
jgi:uncharacterized protein YybS (DUF2232 family)